MSLATVDTMKKIKSQDPKMFEPATCNKTPGVMMNYRSSAAWAWAVYDQEAPKMIMYTDI